MSSASSPPPLPRPVKYAHFEATKNGLHTAAFDRDRIEQARQQALEWINNNPQLEIISIDSSFGKMLAIVTVWYK
ncbi:hypothetical protein [Rubritalea squalenifaciens]|uniref:hypothetical protein n=1 Tax=Rubritalea squalenifaciens TaxID=407226 RepID=UPI0011604FB0|nr:hypothetical protein [Rubritalea squalenifaciens]